MFDLDGRTKALLGLTASVGLGYSISWLMRQQQLKQFEKVGTVKELVVYPVKSCKGVYVSQAECTPLGLSVDGVTDRHWMLIHADNNFFSMRHQPKMALISVAIRADAIELSAPGMTLLRLPKSHSSKTVRKCKVFAGNIQGVDCGDEAADWVSRFLAVDGVRLVHYIPSLAKRFYSKETKAWETTVKDDDVTAYANWSSYLLFTTSSLEAVNKEMPQDFEMRSFRPNIILDGPSKFDEDNWSEIRIGDRVHMRCIDPCVRCIQTTVDLDQGVKREDGEPLKTLKRIRKSSYHKGGGILGMKLAPDVCGSVKVGDPVYALRKTAAH